MVPCTIVTGQKQDPSIGGMHRLNTTWQDGPLFGQTFESFCLEGFVVNHGDGRAWLVRGAISNALAKR